MKTKTRRQKVFLDLIADLRGYELKSVAQNAEVNLSTIYFWLDGTTRTPRLDTFIRVAEAIGYNVNLIVTKTKHLKVA